MKDSLTQIIRTALVEASHLIFSTIQCLSETFKPTALYIHIGSVLWRYTLLGIYLVHPLSPHLHASMATTRFVSALSRPLFSTLPRTAASAGTTLCTPGVWSATPCDAAMPASLFLSPEALSVAPVEGLYADSTMRKRAKKMNKHKYRKFKRLMRLRGAANVKGK